MNSVEDEQPRSGQNSQDRGLANNQSPIDHTSVGEQEGLMGNLYAEPLDRGRLDNVAVAAKRAYEATGVSPEQVEVAEVHDCFTMAEVLKATSGNSLELIGRAS